MTTLTDTLTALDAMPPGEFTLTELAVHAQTMAKARHDFAAGWSRDQVDEARYDFARAQARGTSHFDRTPYAVERHIEAQKAAALASAIARHLYREAVAA